jgi:hypothetical protein
MSVTLFVLRRPAGRQSQFQPRLHHRNGVYTAAGRRSLNFRKAALGRSARLPARTECKRYIGAFKDGIPTACRQLAMPNSCNVDCVAPVQPPAIPPKPPEVSPDPASLRDEVTPPGPAGINTNIQVGGKQYTKVTGLTWVESTKPDSFADVSVGRAKSRSSKWEDRTVPTFKTLTLPRDDSNSASAGPKSFWTQQEIGFAVARGVKIISFKMGEDPTGFISKHQALPRLKRSAEDIAKEVGLLLHDERTATRLKDVIDANEEISFWTPSFAFRRMIVA